MISYKISPYGTSSHFQVVQHYKIILSLFVESNNAYLFSFVHLLLSTQKLSIIL